MELAEPIVEYEFQRLVIKRHTNLIPNSLYDDRT